MNNQSFASLAYDNKKKKSGREKFLQEVDKVIPLEGSDKNRREMLS